jgi:sorbitol/mannitol transport system substrate-binding protein
MSQSKVAMWYDATSAAGSLEDPKVSKVAGKVGYVHAPVEKTKASGWLWAWAWVMPKTTKNSDTAAQFMTWASSKEYEQLVGEKLGWARVPAGKRKSTYEIPEYKKASAAFGEMTLQSIEEANPEDPGVQPRPTVGVQFVAIPEFQDLGTKVSQDIAAAIAGRGSVDEALSKGQTLAEEVAAKQS